jgi:membrane-bound serine protease (ClpP class)
MDPLILALVLIVVGLAVICLEMFIPSAGMLGVLAALLILSGIVSSFFHSAMAGAIVLALTCLTLPVLIALAIKIWPSTPIGKKILIGAMTEQDVLPQGDIHEQLKPLIGRRGVAKTKMLPSGIIVIDDRNYDAISDGFAIEPGTPVEVISIRTKRAVVRPVDADEPPNANRDDVLSQPIEQLGLGPLDEA